MDLPLLACTTWQFISGNHIWLVSVVFFFVWCVIISCKQCLVYKAHKGLAFPQTKASCKQLLSQKLKSWQSTKLAKMGEKTYWWSSLWDHSLNMFTFSVNLQVKVLLWPESFKGKGCSNVMFSFFRSWAKGNSSLPMLFSLLLSKIC